jgi:transposase
MPSEEELRDLLKEGKTLYQISRKFDMVIKEVFKLGRSYGIHFAYDHNRIPRPTKQDLESMYHEEHLTQKQIAKEFNIDQANICRCMCNYNIHSRVPIPPKEVLERMYIDEKMTQYQISRKFNVDQVTVHGWLRKYNIPTRGSNGILAVPIPPKEVLERMYTNEGMYQWQIAQKFNVTPQCVGNWLRYYNIQVIVSKMPPKDDLLKCIADGLNQHQIAENYEVCDSTIFNWCDYYGIPGMVNSYRCTTPEHQEWKFAVFERDHYNCQKCGATNTMMQAHHIVPFADHPEIGYEIENGITLCEYCHRSIRGREYEYIDQFAAITQRP